MTRGKHEASVNRPKTIGKVGLVVAGVGALAQTVRLGWRTTQDMLNAQIISMDVQPVANENSTSAVGRLSQHASDFLMEQAHRSTTVAACVGAVVLAGVGLAARWSHNRNARRDPLVRQGWLVDAPPREAAGYESSLIELDEATQAMCAVSFADEPTRALETVTSAPHAPRPVYEDLLPNRQVTY
jgi:hypothetical protein